jgi:hypothetical protein
MFALRRTLSFALLVSTFAAANGQQPADDAKSHSRAQLAERISDYDWSINILKVGLHRNWDEDRYAKAFASSARASSERGRHFLCVPQGSSQPREIWDEKPPFAVKVFKTLQECERQRDLFVSILHAPPATSTPGK